MPEVFFETVTACRTARGKCSCGKTVTRTKRFEQTVNPYHSAVRDLPEGATMLDASRAVRASVNAEADAWVPDFRHAGCVEAVDR